MRKTAIATSVVLLILAFAGAVSAADISGNWDVKVHGYNYFTDRTPSRVPIAETETTMKIEQDGDRVSVTFGAFAGVHSATLFAGSFGQNRIVATWWYQGYPHETKVITGQYSPDTDRISGKMLYPRAADKPGLVPGWVEVNFVATRKVEAVLPQPIQPVKPVIPAVVPLLLKEDCISFNPATTEVKNISGRWKVVDGSHWILDFGANKGEADKSLAIIKHYGMDSVCFVGRPDPSMTYWRVNGQAPSGPVSGEDAIGFNPDTIEVREINGRWKIVDGSHWIMDFEGNEGEARTAFQVIKKYGFRYICFVGRPDPSMTYFRK
ncbi:MAG TPA: hypothetical protein PLP89_03310 [Synergistales bacterium]|jgi:hypothetical protein|nr:hypothetical protein [Synergistales bacterium]